MLLEKLWSSWSLLKTSFLILLFQMTFLWLVIWHFWLGNMLIRWHSVVITTLIIISFFTLKSQFSNHPDLTLDLVSFSFVFAFICFIFFHHLSHHCKPPVSIFRWMILNWMNENTINCLKVINWNGWWQIFVWLWRKCTEENKMSLFADKIF